MRDTIAGRFELLTPIAEGGSGAVWRANDLRLGRECAAKVLRQRDSADLLRFVREQSVNLEHPHVVAPYGWAAEDEHVAIAMELVSGGTLEAALQDNGAVADWLAEELVCQLLEALHFVHARGWVHRDVKPANVLLEPTGAALPVARLADFGIAVRLHDARLTHTGTVVGTPGYLPHEAYAPGNPSRAMDLYAAGVTAVRTVLPEVDLSGDPLGPHDVARLSLFEDSPALRNGVSGLLSPEPHERTAAADRLLGQLLAGAPARAEREAETADGEPFEVFDVLEPTTERELSPVADAARLPAADGRAHEAPIAWHAVHRQAIPKPTHPALVQRGADPLRPFGPVTVDGSEARPGGGDAAGGAAGTAAPAGNLAESAVEHVARRSRPEPHQPQPGSEHSGPGHSGAERSGSGHPGSEVPTPDTTRELVAGDSTERLDSSAASALAASGARESVAVSAQDPERVTSTSHAPEPTTRMPAVRTPDTDEARPDAVPSRAADVPAPVTRRRRRARWPWWTALVVLATLALVAGYVWLGPWLARWTGGPQPTTPEPTAPTTSSAPPQDATPEPAEATPVCTELEDGTVSCVVTL